MIRVVACLLAALVLGACAQPPPPAPTNVVLVLVDALRADHLGCYGYARPTSPHLDALAAESTLFRDAVTAAPWTLPAMATLWTSLYPSVHGAIRASHMKGFSLDPERFRPSSRLESSRLTLAEILRDAGFATAAFIDGAYATSPFGLTQGFDARYEGNLDGLRPNVEALLEWLDRQQPAKFFTYLHTLAVHSPYVGPRLWSGTTERQILEAKQLEEERRYEAMSFDPTYSGWMDGSQRALGAIGRPGRTVSDADRAHLVALYDQGIAYADFWIGRLIDGLAQRGLLEQTVFVVTADHGEELLDHGGLQHGTHFYDEAMRVPLFMRTPGSPPRVVTQQVGLIDVMPTLLELLGTDRVLDVQGRSLVPLIRGEALPERALFAEAPNFGGLRALRTERWKYITTPGTGTLFDLQSDPHETVNLCASNRSACAPFARQMAEWQNANRAMAARLGFGPGAPARVDEALRRKLRALGYEEP